MENNQDDSKAKTLTNGNSSSQGDTAFTEVMSNQNDDMSVKNKVPIDSGWAWMILLGALVYLTIVVGALKNSGIYFIQWQERFNATSSMTSLIISVQSGVYSVSSLIVTRIGLKLASCRVLIVIGTVLCSTSYIIMALAPNIVTVIVAQGTLTGFGFACLTPPILVIINQYFEKRRGLANSVALSGASLGGLIFAPLITMSFEYYGYKGTHLLVAANMLHGFIAAALFRPPEFYTRIRPKIAKISPKTSGDKNGVLKMEGERLISMRTLSEANNEKDEQLNMKQASQFMDVMKYRHFSRSLSQPEPSIDFIETMTRDRSNTSDTCIPGYNHRHQGGHKRALSETEKVGSVLDILAESMSKLDMAVFPSVEFLPGSAIFAKSTPPDDSSCQSEKMQSRHSLRHFVCGIIADIFDFEMLKNPVAIILFIFSFIVSSGFGMIQILLPPTARESGISEQDIAILMMIYSFLDLVFRTVIGFISDKKFLRRSTIISIAAVLLGITFNFMYFIKSFEAFVVISCVAGVISGTYVSLFSVNIVDYLGIEKHSSGLGFTILCHGASMALFMTISGTLRDATGSYVSTFHLVSALLLTGACVGIVLPVVDNRRKARKKAPRNENCEEAMSLT
ncbi:hypothetical protein CHS0354_020548 [Potamilus streckersoni]|uniref:Major facilitator superfamily (MFS) profile domain-containing protein n=1 Tax=Potamilus streckersoni TaxID=2493646 RepID=A0AAE0SNB2_9BIVA|nr:hypothetical protein CHS0354_020548 [Potamilus streckersoni]